MTNNTEWEAKWITRPGTVQTDWRAKVLPAPFFRRVFAGEAFDSASIRICGLGFYELYLNGRRVGDHVLDPVVTQYDKRVRFVEYDVSDYLRKDNHKDKHKGKNVIGVILGNGWYNCHTADIWHFDKAVWRDYPKLTLELRLDDRIALTSDTQWRCSDGPILFDGLRNGESYDARREPDGWLDAGYDDSGWTPAVFTHPPGGVMEEQTMPPCKIMETVPPVRHWKNADGDRIFDMGRNLTGWVRIRARGRAGDTLKIEYGELLENDDLDQSNINSFILSGDCQTDRYIFRGAAEEEWEPRFTYHGFQFVRVAGDAESLEIEGRMVHTAFDEAGTFTCSDETLNTLQKLTRASYLGNFTGIPTDCPHREKNGWTGDAQLAVETGLYNFHAGEAYAQWIANFPDVQRPNGQLPGIVPSSGWGYNWGSGPAWDSALLEIPWQTWLFTGNTAILADVYEAMGRYVEYLTCMADDGIVSIGLGDWCHVAKERIVDPALTSTGYFYRDLTILEQIARLFDDAPRADRCARTAAMVRDAFNAKFYRGNGIYAKGEPTAMGAALYFGLTEEAEITATVKALAEKIEANEFRAEFGILGAKFIPRVLADNGRVDDAFRLITQPEFPGWGYWVLQGAATLWESWKGDSSRNHIMFGDISAWMFRYIGGLRPDPENPGFRHVLIQPMPAGSLTRAKAERLLPSGTLRSEWIREGDRFCLDLTLPDGTSATVTLPDGTATRVESGKHRLTCC